jgi:peptide/nickel transport system substrate-binding protein
MSQSSRPLVALVLAVVLLAAGAADAQTPKRGGVFRVPAPEPPSLDPHRIAGFSTQLYASPVYGQLVRFPAGPEAKDAADHRIMPDIAEKWEYTTPTTLVFTLRKGIRFHKKPPVNGRELTAEDVKFSLERFREKSSVRSRLEPVQSIDVVDRYTVRLVLRQPYAPLLNYLANPSHCAIMPRELGANDITTAAAVIGTGPFVLRSYQRGVRAVYERNHDYQMPGLPYLDGLVIEVVPDAAARIALLQAGKLELAHWWGWLTPEEGRVLKRTHPELTIQSRMVVDLAHVFMRTDQPPFNDVRVRRAVTLAIDRKAWREALHYDEGCLDSGPIPCSMTDWKLTAERMDSAKARYLTGYDVKEAKRLLAEAGVPRGFATPIHHWPGFAPPWRSYYDLVTESLTTIGLGATLVPEELGKYTSMTALGKYEKMGMGPFGAGETEVDSFLYDTFFSDSPRNRSHVADPELDRLLLAQRRELDPARRREMVYEIQRYLADKAYYVYLPMWPRYIAHPAYVKGFKHIDGYSLGTRLLYVWFDK